MSEVITRDPGKAKTLEELTPEEAVRELRALRERIPQFVQLPVVESLSLTRAATLSMEFIHAAINAIAAWTGLQAALGHDAAELRREAETAARWSQVLDEIDAVRLGVVGAIRVRRHRLGTIALRAYQVSRSLILDKPNVPLLPHVDAMKRTGKFGKYRVSRNGDGESEQPPQAGK